MGFTVAIEFGPVCFLKAVLYEIGPSNTVKQLDVETCLSENSVAVERAEIKTYSLTLLVLLTPGQGAHAHTAAMCGHNQIAKQCWLTNKFGISV